MPAAFALLFSVFRYVDLLRGDGGKDGGVLLVAEADRIVDVYLADAGVHRHVAVIDRAEDRAILFVGDDAADIGIASVACGHVAVVGTALDVNAVVDVTDDAADVEVVVGGCVGGGYRGIVDTIFD